MGLNKENQLLLQIGSALSDAAIVVLSMLLAYFLRFRILHGEESMPLAFYFRSALIISLLYLLLFATLEMYEIRRYVLLLPMIQQIIIVSFVCTAVLATVYFTSYRIYVSRVLLLLFFLFSSVLLSLKRVLVQRHLRSAYLTGNHVRQVLLAGSGPAAAEYLRTLKEMPWLGYQVTASIGARPLSDEVPYLGPIGNLDEVLRETAAEELVAALDADEFADMDRIVNLTEKYGLKFSLIPYFASYMLAKPYIDQVGSVPLINIRRIPLDNLLNGFVKRAFDVAGSLFLIVLTSPIMAAAALGTLLTIGRPVIFRQERVGYERRNFTMLKFRSMRAPQPGDSSGWSRYDGKRLTPFGAFLRRSSIDELPQLFNVLKGDMSLVGPRPELPEYVEQFRETVPLYMVKHQVRPGMTGLAQVNGYRGDTSIEARIRLDLRYIETWSFLLDVKILIQTLFHITNHEEGSHHAEVRKSKQGKNKSGGK